MIAFACRYGHQRREDVEKWPIDDLREFCNDTTYWLQQENPDPDGDGSDEP
jgi:hypothetical protein